MRPFPLKLFMSMTNYDSRNLKMIGEYHKRETLIIFMNISAVYATILSINNKTKIKAVKAIVHTSKIYSDRLMPQGGVLNIYVLCFCSKSVK